MRWPAAVCLVLAAGLAAIGAGGLVRAGSHTATKAVVVDGVPILEVSAVPPPVRAPGVVVAHGFAGSARLMRGFADTLAARGYVVALPDFTGHGDNPAHLPGPDERASAALSRDLDAAVRHLRALATVDPARIGLVGHSMGAQAVTRYATERGGIAATVAISLRSADDLPGEPTRPRNLLLLVGGAEFAGFRDAARAGLHAAYPTAALGTTVGDPAAGTARRAVSVPAVEHISVLYATTTHAETAAWLDAAFGSPSHAPTHPRDRLVPAGLLLLAFMLGTVPLVGWLAPPAERAPVGPVPLAGWYAYPALGGGLLLAGLVGGAVPTSRLPIAIGGYVTGFLALAAAVLLAGWAVGRRGPAAVEAAVEAVEAARSSRPRWLVIGAILTTYAVLSVAVPTHLGLLHAVPVGARWWLLPIVAISVGLFLYAAELVSAGRWWRYPVTLAALATALLLAAVTGLGPAFILLVLPLLVVLLAWQAGWSLVLRRRSGPPWLAAAVGAALVGWPIAVTLPLVS